MILYTPAASRLETDPRNPCGQVVELTASNCTLYVTEKEFGKVADEFGTPADGFYTYDELMAIHSFCLCRS